jgi:N-methylhydantoinase A
VVSVEKGFDTRDFSLVAFGGAGAMHACELACTLEIPRVIVPAMPGALSAVGILMSDIVKDYSRTVLLDVEKSLPMAKLESEFKKLKAKALKDFKAERWPGKVQFEARSEMRYRGQGFEISVLHGASALDAFHEEHQRMYGYRRVGSPVEIVTVRLRAWIKTVAPKMASGAGKHDADSRESSVSVTFAGKAQRARIVGRSSLASGKKFSGPAIVTEYSATTVVPPNWNFSVDRFGNLILEQKKRRPRGRP